MSLLKNTSLAAFLGSFTWVCAAEPSSLVERRQEQPARASTSTPAEISEGARSLEEAIAGSYERLVREGSERWASTVAGAAGYVDLGADDARTLSDVTATLTTVAVTYQAQATVATRHQQLRWYDGEVVSTSEVTGNGISEALAKTMLAAECAKVAAGYDTMPLEHADGVLVGAAQDLGFRGQAPFRRVYLKQDCQVRLTTAAECMREDGHPIRGCRYENTGSRVAVRREVRCESSGDSGWKCSEVLLPQSGEDYVQGLDGEVEGLLNADLH